MKKKGGRPRLSFAEKIRRSARPHETAGEVAYRLMRYGASFLDSARYLEERGYRTPRGSLRWTARQVCFEYLKTRAAKGRGWVKRRIDVTEARALLKASDEELPRLLEWSRVHDMLEAGFGITRATTYPLRTKVKSAKARAQANWWAATEAARARGEPGPPEPRFDSRGRLLKGRRFSRVRTPK